ncbi:MAG: DUF3857 domain-containing protein [Bacteroidota bacterium]
MKFGKISDREKALQHCAFDSTAASVILCDYGTIKMRYNQPMLHTRHKRIKIFNEKDLEQANISIPFYSFQNVEHIKRIKAQTINFDEKGKMIKKSVDSKQIFKKTINEYWSEMVFTFPAVEAGSIIEYSYQHYSEYFTFLRKWYFQNDLPTLHSELRTNVAQGLDYRSLMKGDRLYRKYLGQDVISTWALKDLPGLKNEAFCPNYQDYAEHIQFQLAGYYTTSRTSPGTPEYVSLMNTWEKLISDMLDAPSYQVYLSRKGKVRNIVENIVNGETDQLVIVKKLYYYLANTFEWNGQYLLFADQKLGN